MNLTIDIGNSLVKMTLIDNGQVVDFVKIEDVDIDDLSTLICNNPEINAAIMVSVRDRKPEVEEFLKNKLTHFIYFDHTTPVPLANAYTTPQTLGADRLAAAVGAATLYPNSDVLIADFGTAITFDVVSAEGVFLGGNISPGAATRFRSLHLFTKKLPLKELIEDVTFLGTNSDEAIQNGVINGIVYEIEGYIRDLRKKYANLRIIFTGGEGNFFAKRLKNPIFATYDLVAYGLNRILEHNAKQ